MKLIGSLVLLFAFTAPAAADLTLSASCTQEGVDCCVGEGSCYKTGDAGSATVGGGSCIADDDDVDEIKNACAWSGADIGGSFAVAEDSCLGKNVCLAAGRTGTVTVGTGSCIGSQGCQDIGKDGSAAVGDGSCIAVEENPADPANPSIARACGWSGRDGGSFTVAGDSCLGKNACISAGRTGTVTVGTGSCVGSQGCQDIGKDGSATVGDGSCISVEENPADPANPDIALACGWSGRDGGSFAVAEDSCLGKNACISAGRTGIATVGTGSCVGSQVCQDIGKDGSATVGDGSCNSDEERACPWSGRDGGVFTAGDGSCLGKQACESSGRYAGSSAELGAGSCIGDNACQNIGMRGNVEVGDESCLGYRACYQSAKEGGLLEIGDRSCQAPESCNAIQYDFQAEGITEERSKITIGNDACNCEGCCGCLKPGDIVPDNMCNDFGDGATNCCINDSDRNPWGPLQVSNLCAEEENKCYKASVTGDPHLTTFSQLKYDCMGQGEFLLAKSQDPTDPLEIRGLFVDPQFTGEANPWENDRSAQTVTRGVAFKVDNDVPLIRIMTDPEASPDTCDLYFHVEGVGEVSLDQMLTDETLFARGDGGVVVTSWNSGTRPSIKFLFGDYDADIIVSVGKSGDEVNAKWGCIMAVSTCLKPKYHGDVIGLFGTNNLAKDDDWTLPDGTILPIPTDPKSAEGRGLSTDYCLNYCNSGQAEDSFFSAEDFNYYSRCDMTPFSGKYNEEALTELLAKIKASCDAAEVFHIPSSVMYDAALANHINDPEATECPVGDIAAALLVNEENEFNCAVTPGEPTSAPTSVPTSGPTSGPTTDTQNTETSEIKGDPHFTTWLGEHFEYHGQCDLVMLKDESFADGLGIQIQIRTKMIRFWSYIRSIAVRIGDEILEVEGSADTVTDNEELFYFYNLRRTGAMETLGGFPVTAHRRSEKTQKFVIDLNSKYPGQSIEIMTFKEFVKVSYINGNELSVGKSVGMMGQFKTGKTLARDGETVVNDFNDYGAEWQVRPEDEMLFHDVQMPQFPKACILPEDPQGERRRRLDESSIKIEEAEKACSQLKNALDRKDCVYDVLATQDLDMVGAF